MTGHEELTIRRLSLRRPAAGDVEAVLAIHGDPAACLHNPFDALATRAEAEGAREPGRRVAAPRLPLLDRPGARGLRRAGLLRRQADGAERSAGPEPLLPLRPRRPGPGLASEAATAVVAWAGTAEPGLPLIARVRPADVASRRMALRAGLLRAEHLDGEGYDGFDRICHRPAGR